jgi:biotin carboxyl carrier protein
MNVDDIRSILELVREHELSEFELELEGLKLKVKKPGSGPGTHGPATAYPPLPSGGRAGLSIVKSPLVGTFYRSPEPGAPPFAEKGAVVKKGQVLCIIEAMKLMNEIESDYDGEVVAAYVENGQPVQYGERLFAIRVRAS